MDLTIFKPEIQEFINQNIETDVSLLALKKNPFPEIDYLLILNQVTAKTKAKYKLPTFFNANNIIYPSRISVEQTSSEKTAQFKSTLVSGKNLIDLTGGFGIDDFYFAKKIKNVFHCEINQELSEIVKHNFQILKVDNVKCFNQNSYEVLKSYSEKYFDWIYIDPSRRTDIKGKVFMLKDCLPNVPEHLEFYFKYSDNILIKTAPILDISAGLLELSNVKEIHIVSLENEVKEILWALEKDFIDKIKIKTVNIVKENSEIFNFTLNENQQLPHYCLPKKYLYEPNAAIMKSGAFNEIAIEFKLNKLHQFSHLYTSEEKKDFPGRIFEIDKCINYTKIEMKNHFENQKANITTRNFPETVEAIRKKFKIKDGGNRYCFFTTNANQEKIALICTKI
ncbi:MAG: class I SAM-dependent methyltransferase [Flavobacterium sp.]|nr:class I SAM-dependent methyltransferase [Flavobacterium sp.]